MRNPSRYKLGRGGRAALLALVPIVGLAACDFEVTNPGPVEDEFLSNAAAHLGVVNGAGRDFSEALAAVALTSSITTREQHSGGTPSPFGHSVSEHEGYLRPDDTNEHWMMSQRARWTAEDGTRRLREALGADFASSELAAQILVWSGYANRLLGENFCEAVIDEGPREPNSVYFERAESQLTEAIAIATAAGQSNLATSARAARASVRVFRGNWAGAVEDASSVPTDFVYQIDYSSGELPLYNPFYFSVASQPYRASTVWNTWFAEYYPETQDPRVPWRIHPEHALGSGAVGDLGSVPFYQQRKYNDLNAPIRLSSGREMRLIEAEAMLRDGDWQGAVAVINELRAALGVATVPQVSASSATEAWTLLKRERGIELWLEARRLGDRRRWAEGNVPGDLHPLEVPGEAANLVRQDLCFPISENEMQTNPNLRG